MDQNSHKAAAGRGCGPGLQVAALCYGAEQGRALRVLLITSRGTGRWILPKGWIVAGCTEAESAAQEAWEEAGVQGAAADHCLGHYHYVKFRPGAPPVPCRVAVYPLAVTGLADRYPEYGERLRKWLAPKQAATVVQEPRLARILSDFDPHMLPEPPAAT